MATVDSEVVAEKCEQIARTCGCFSLRRIARAVTQLYDQMLAPAGLQITQLGILRVCGLHGPITVAGIARELMTDSRTIMRNLKPLVAAGLLQRTRGAEGGRTRSVELTAEGRVALAKGIVQWDRAQHDLINRLGEARWRRLEAELSEIMNLSALMPPA